MYKLVQIKKGQHVFACHKTFNHAHQTVSLHYVLTIGPLQSLFMKSKNYKV